MDKNYTPQEQKKIAAIISNMDKGHYLSNGNKRISFGMVVLFLSLEQCLEDYINNSFKLQQISNCIDLVSINELTKETLIEKLRSIV